MRRVLFLLVVFMGCTYQIREFSFDASIKKDETSRSVLENVKAKNVNHLLLPIIAATEVSGKNDASIRISIVNISSDTLEIPYPLSIDDFEIYIGTDKTRIDKNERTFVYAGWDRRNSNKKIVDGRRTIRIPPSLACYTEITCLSSLFCSSCCDTIFNSTNYKIRVNYRHPVIGDPKIEGGHTSKELSFYPESNIEEFKKDNTNH